jgi:hypothetical protein
MAGSSRELTVFALCRVSVTSPSEELERDMAIFATPVPEYDATLISIQRLYSGRQLASSWRED